MLAKNLKLLFLFFIVALFITSSVVYLEATKKSEEKEEGFLYAQLAHTELYLEVADSPSLHSTGLSSKQSLGESDGMLFIFPEESRYSMWMKDMNFSLDILWINKEGEVVFIEENISPDTFPKSFVNPAPALYVLEVEAGRVEYEGWAVGDQIFFGDTGR